MCSVPDSEPESHSLTLARTFLGQRVEVVIDRPLGSRHPRHGFLYAVNYGYVPGTLAPDSDALDAYVLGPEEPFDRFTGHCLAIIHRSDDDDDKLVIVPEGLDPTDAEMMRAVWFQERFSASRIVR